MLFEVALRLYEPRLREIAPEHLKAHADAALTTARLLPGAVASQLTRRFRTVLYQEAHLVPERVLPERSLYLVAVEHRLVIDGED